VTCMRATVSGGATIAAFLAAAFAMNDNVFTTKAGATTTAPAVLVSVIVLTPVAVEVLWCRVSRQCRRHKLVGRRRSACCTALCHYAAAFAAGLLLFLVIVWPIRAMSGAHLDDVSVRAVVDGRFSECFHMPNFLALPNAQFLWIIPINSGINISSNASWCAQMAELRSRHGLTLGMHGVHHQYQPDGKREFEGLPLPEARERVELGLAVWHDAFGERPSHFSLPGEWSSPEIVRMLTDEYGFTVRTLVDGLFHRIYHCDDSFCGDAAAFCRSWALNIF